MNTTEQKINEACNTSQRKRCSPCIASKVALVYLALMALVQLWEYFA